MVEVIGEEECGRAHAQFEQFDRNWAWLQEHASEVYSQHRGKHLCVAGQELFVADSMEEVLGLAEAAHPEDGGRFVRYVLKERGCRV
jgi:hypothetical protein